MSRPDNFVAPSAGANGKLTKGINKDNMEQYKEKIKQQAIQETIELLKDTGRIKDTFKEGWKGKAEETFEQNLNAAINQTEKTLNKLDGALDKLFSKIGSSWDEQDRTVVKPLN